jgi:hypothetical protein
MYIRTIFLVLFSFDLRHCLRAHCLHGLGAYARFWGWTTVLGRRCLAFDLAGILNGI